MKSLLKNKKGMEFKSSLFAILAFGIIIFAIGVQLNQWNQDYDTNLIEAPDVQELNREYYKASDMQTQASDSKIVGTSTGKQEDFEDTSYKGVFGLLNTMYQSFEIITGTKETDGMLDSIQKRFKIADYIINFILAIITIAITWALVAIIFRRPTRST